MSKDKKRMVISTVVVILTFTSLMSIIYLWPSMRDLVRYHDTNYENRLRDEMCELYSKSKTRGPYWWISDVSFSSLDYFCMIHGIILMDGAPNPNHDPEIDGYITFMPQSKRDAKIIPDGYPAYIITPNGEVFKHDKPAKLPLRYVKRLDMVTGGTMNSLATILLDYKDNPTSWKKYGKINYSDKGNVSFEKVQSQIEGNSDTKK